MSAYRFCFLLLLASAPVQAQSADQVIAHRVTIETRNYQGRSAVRLTAGGDARGAAYALVKDVTFHNGSIDVDLAGFPAAGSFEAARGFIGVAFRVQDTQFEHIYLRPTNGRADDQVRRNHATQCSAYPSYGYDVLRRESPEKYESYVDLEPGVWTHYRVVVRGTTARLYVNGASQPCLIVNDLKLGDSVGGVALWIDPSTEGYFANLMINAEP